MSTIEKINLSNLKRCNQNWDEMSPTDCGRLCGKCNKVIIDFRNLTDKEIAEIHLFSEEPVCGVYRKQQLQAPTKEKKVKQPKKWKSLYLGILGLLLTKQIDAQTAKDTARIEQIEKIIDEVPENQEQKPIVIQSKNQDSLIISGRITDRTGEPLIQASVIIHGTRIGSSSDYDGNYRLNITEQFEKNKEVTLRYYYTGFSDVYKTITSRDSLSMDIQMIEEVPYLPNYGILPPPLAQEVLVKDQKYFQEKAVKCK